jgi:predicted homoserine dehydrogenase-like protein
MIIIDHALEERAKSGCPILVALVGAGFMGRAIVLQVNRFSQGMKIVCVVNRTLENARLAFEQAGCGPVREIASAGQLSSCIDNNQFAVTDDFRAATDCSRIDVIVEVTGSVEYGAQVALRAFENRKHVIVMNAELDGTLGPLLRSRALAAGVIFTDSDGDQPGVIVNLFRFVKGIGLRPVLCGNIKGLHDPYRNPTTQEAFARRWGQNPKMVTSFADGTKINFEQAIVANATGMSVARRGMLGPTVETGASVLDAPKWYPETALETPGGIVDYVVGASPSPGVFVIGRHDHPIQRHYLNLYKLGEGPYYVFYTPYHLCHFELPKSIARVALFHDAVLVPEAGPRVEVVTAAKVDLLPGDVLDGFGGYKTYGLAENYPVARRENLLPMGISEGCRVIRPVGKDQVLTYGDVERPAGRLVDKLRSEQDALYPA